MAKPFQVDVVTPEQVIWTGMATFVLTRTVDGEIGILADHEPTMGTLAVGGTHIEPVDEPPVNIAVEGGFLQIHRNTVTLVTDHAEIVAGGIEDARRVADRFAAESGTWIDMAAAYERPEGSG